LITVIGSINLDLIARVDRLPAPGETVTGGGFSSAPGGKGANQALAARRAVLPVRMVGAVGRDAYAEAALELLRSGGVDLGAVEAAAEPTGVALILVGPDGENMIAVAPGANHAVTPPAIARHSFAPGEHILLQNEIPLAANEAAVLAARRAGAVSLMNTAPFLKEAAGLVGKADYFIANETEFDLYSNALELAGASRSERMADFASRTGRTAIVTLGGEGVAAAAPGGLLYAPALKITPVDTVGAGDTFCGYLGASLAGGLSLEQSLRRAAAAASLACLKRGAQPAIPLAEEVDAASRGG
jgi:ribokinase